MAGLYGQNLGGVKLKKGLKDNHILYVLSGPTGIGKSRLAIKLANKYDGEIISADSRQIYKYMDIGTAKPSLEERKEAPHHLIDLFSPEEIINAGKYAELADKAMKDIWKRGKNAFLVGGSGLYIRASLKGIFEGPGRDEAVREKLEQEAEEFGFQRLYERLKKIDVKCAEKIHPNDKRRIIRGLEVYTVTGKKISEWQKETSACDFIKVCVCLYQNMDDLYQRIEKRCEEMIAKGLIEEVKGLIEKGLGGSPILKDTIGYKEILEYINGKMSLDESIEFFKKNSRRLAKGQMTWFRSEKGLKWIEVRKGESEEEMLDKLAEAYGF